MEKVHQFMSKDFSGEDLYNLAAENDIYIIEENLGVQIAGYYNHTFGEKLIHINSEIPRYYKDFVIAYFLPKNTNKRTQESGISLLTIQKLTNKFMELSQAI